jgi:seryl-tRNA synthetase
MLQVSYIRDNREQVLERLAVKNFKRARTLVNLTLNAEYKYKEAKIVLEAQKGEVKVSSSEIAKLKNQPNRVSEMTAKQKVVRMLKKKIKTQEKLVEKLEKRRDGHLVKFPNLPHISVPRGKVPADNEEVFKYGNFPSLPLNSLPHWELAAKYNLIDFELGVKITGAGFPVYKGKGAKLQRALIAYFLDEAENAGYKEVMLPLMVNRDSAFGTGQLPDKEGQMYYVNEDEFYLIPTAEVPITNIYRDVILKGDDLPIKNCGHTPCFRREAGSYGAHVRGLNRLHQFDKVEIVQVVHPDRSYETLEQMSAHVQSLLKNLGLPYRVLRLCGGDMGFASALTYDMETWSAAQQRWLEVSSVSNFETFQSNRLKLRFRNAEGKTQLAHTLNGSALALPRIVATLLENNQTEKGIKIPEVLVPYTKFEWID